MTHSVEGHLALKVSEYDHLIRRLIPAYETMRAVQLDLIGLALPSQHGLVLDLGGGTGALAAAIAERFSTVSVQLWDTDATMLAAAAERCSPWGNRVQCVQKSYVEPLPPSDAVVASLSLHHVRSLELKSQIYRQIFESLRPGGVFVNADTAVATTPLWRDRALRQWARSMETHGITQEQAFAKFRSWAEEDYYPPLFSELQRLAAAGFDEPECFWRDAAAVVFGAMR